MEEAETAAAQAAAAERARLAAEESAKVGSCWRAGFSVGVKRAP